MVHGWPKQGHSPIESFRCRLYAICILGHLFFVRTVSSSLLPLPSASAVPVLFIDCLVFARTLSGDNISPVQTWRWLRLIMHSKFQLMWLRNFVVWGKLWTAETMEIIISRYATMNADTFWRLESCWWLKYKNHFSFPIPIPNCYASVRRMHCIHILLLLSSTCWTILLIHNVFLQITSISENPKSRLI